MSDDTAKTGTIVSNALWSNNMALVQLLGLCPLLGVSNSVVNALGLGLATVVVLGLSSLSVALCAKQITDTIRLPAFMIIIASFTTCIELVMQAYTYELYTVLGIFIPIIVTNCGILGRAEAFARRNGVVAATVDGVACGIGFSLVLILLGAMRELLGQGTLFADMHLLLGNWTANWEISVSEAYNPVLVAILPPGAFIGVGLLIAVHTQINHLIEQHRAQYKEKVVAGLNRARVTGNISAN